jgi:hypothetical protein
MIRRARFLRVVALLAAYVVALQALLLPLSVAVGDPIDLSLCAAATSVESSPAPVSPQTGCPCAAGCGMQCAIHALSGPPSIAVAIADIRAGATASAPGIYAVVRLAERQRPQIPRAPPAA